MGIKKESYARKALADFSKDPETAIFPYIIANPNSQIQMLHGDSEGYIALFKKFENIPSQYHYRIENIEKNLQEWLQPDSYVSMNTFYTPKRLVTNLKQIRTSFVDIDCYNMGQSAEEIGYLLKRKYFGVSLPTPNMMIYSGRGLNLIWMLEPMSGLALERWENLQRAIYKTVKSLGADKKALDGSRIFRLAGTTNSKNNAQVFCEVFHENRISFDTFVNTYFPSILRRIKMPYKSYEKKKDTSSKIKHIFNSHTLVQARMSDIEKLLELREGNMTGCREYALFLYRYWALVERGNKDDAKDRMLKVNEAFNIPLPRREALADTKSAERYYDKDKVFRITHKRVIEWLEITPEEQKGMKTIISSAEKKRRNTIRKRETRRENGVKERAQYNENRKSKKMIRLDKLRLLIVELPTATQRELADMLGVSVMTVNRDIAEISL